MRALHGFLLVRIHDARLGLQSIPVEVRDAHKLLLRAHGLSGQMLELPEGKYIVTATLPDGNQAGAEDLAKVVAGQTTEVALSCMLPLSVQADSCDPTPVSEIQLLGPVANVVYNSEFALATVRVNLVPLMIERAMGDGVLSVERVPMPSRSVLERGPQPLLIEAKTAGRVIYLAVPFDENRPTAVCLDLATGDRLRVVWDFMDPSLNAFFAYVDGGFAAEARELSRSVLGQVRSFLFDGVRSPLAASLSAYVLLRANELEKIDDLTRELLELSPSLPDARALRVEYLARMGKHAEAVRILLGLVSDELPWFRSGIGYLSHRAQLYSASVDNLDLTREECEQLRNIEVLLSRLVATLDPRHTIAAYHGIEVLDTGTMKDRGYATAELATAVQSLVKNIKAIEQKDDRRRIVRCLIDQLGLHFDHTPALDAQLIRSADRLGMPGWVVECFPSLMVPTGSTPDGFTSLLLWYPLADLAAELRGQRLRVRGTLCSGLVKEVDADHGTVTVLRELQPFLERPRTTLPYASDRAMSNVVVTAMSAVELAQRENGSIDVAEAALRCRRNILNREQISYAASVSSA